MLGIMFKKDQKKLPVAIIGAGPVGLAAAAHLISKGEEVLIFEEGESVGYSVLKWGSVKMFSPWQYNVDKEAEKLLKKSGWIAPDLTQLPTGRELVENYLKPLSDIPEISKSLILHAKVIGVGKKGLDKVKSSNRENAPFIIYVESDEHILNYEVKAVIDATGTWSNPNPVASNGIYTKNEINAREHIYYGIPELKREKERYAGKKVLVVGSGHSSINILLELAKLKEEHSQTEILWVIRKSKVEDVYGGKENDQLAARGELGSRLEKLINAHDISIFTEYQVTDFSKHNDKVSVKGAVKDKIIVIEGIDEVISATGSRPDFSFLREVRLNIDSSIESSYELAPLIDPNIHSCGTVRPHGEKELRHFEKNFYIVGMKSYGRAPTFLLATGYEQVRSVVAYLTGDFQGAVNVKLELPETGVCNIGLVDCCEEKIVNNQNGRCTTIKSDVASESTDRLQNYPKENTNSCCS